MAKCLVRRFAASKSLSVGEGALLAKCCSSGGTCIWRWGITKEEEPDEEEEDDGERQLADDKALYERGTSASAGGW